jgi:hypothetical protein
MERGTRRVALAATRERQISVRVSAETDRWLERQVAGSRGKAGFVRELIERERARQKEQEYLEMFNRAAGELNKDDIAEREVLVGGFSGMDDSEAGG